MTAQRITAADCANDFGLYGEYYDTSATTTREEFDAQPFAQKWLEIAECFADNARYTEDGAAANAELAEARAAQ